jgi:competence protein CoiA
MLSGIRDSDGNEMLAPEVERGGDTYRCPERKSVVVLKKCRLKTDHFAHKPPVTCEYGVGESENHRTSKLAIYQSLKSFNDVTKLKLERGLQTIRPDVSFKFQDAFVAFELQISSLTVESIIRRTVDYGKKPPIALLWIPQWTGRLAKAFYAPSAWERWLHAVYFGQVYYWKNGLKVVPCHFGECYLWKRGRSWHTNEGDERRAGGYWRKSKRYVVPLLGQELDLLKDFGSEDRPEWTVGRLPVPAHKMWRDLRKCSWPTIPRPEEPPEKPWQNAMSVNGNVISTPQLWDEESPQAD